MATGAEHQPAPAPHGWRADAVVMTSLGREWLERPRVRLSLAGAGLLVLGALVIGGSVWTLPLVIGGALMVLTAWIGHRLEGRLALQWGPDGAQLDFRATVKPALDAAPQPPPALPARPAADDVIDGEAHTVEIDIAELKALIAAAEAADEIRISRGQPLRSPGP